MTLVFAIAMSALAAAPLVAIRLGRVAALLSAAGCALLVLVGLTAALGGAQPVLELGGWLGFGSSALRANGLAGIFLALAGVTGAAVSLAYAELPAGRWLTGLSSVLLLAVAVTIGSDNAFLFFLAWELLTVCIYLIASADREHPGELLAGYLTGGLAKIGGAALLAAFALLYAHTHSFSLAAWTHASLSAGTRGLLFALFLTSFATKVGVIPLQGGLPAGYGAAPRLGAASLSVALCAGFYGLWRFEFQILGPLPIWCGDALLILGALTAMLGILYALTQDDLRRFLGYSTVEHTGYRDRRTGCRAARSRRAPAETRRRGTARRDAPRVRAQPRQEPGADRRSTAWSRPPASGGSIPSAGSPACCPPPRSVLASRR